MSAHFHSHAVHRLLLEEQVHLLCLQVAIATILLLLLLLMLLIEHIVLLMDLLLRVVGGLLGPVGRRAAALAWYGAATTCPPVLVRLQLLTMTLSKRLLLHGDGARRDITLLLLDGLLVRRLLTHGLPWWLVLRLCRGAG